MEEKIGSFRRDHETSIKNLTNEFTQNIKDDIELASHNLTQQYHKYVASQLNEAM